MVSDLSKPLYRANALLNSRPNSVLQLHRFPHILRSVDQFLTLTRFVSCLGKGVQRHHLLVLDLTLLWLVIVVSGKDIFLRIRVVLVGRRRVLLLGVELLGRVLWSTILGELQV